MRYPPDKGLDEVNWRAERDDLQRVLLTWLGSCLLLGWSLAGFAAAQEPNATSPAVPASPASPPPPIPARPAASFPSPTAPAETRSSNSANQEPSNNPLKELEERLKRVQETAQRQIETLEKDEALEAAVREQALQAYRSAIEVATRGAEDLRNSLRDAEEAKKVSAEAERFRRELSAQPERLELEVQESSDLKAIEQALTQAEADLRTYEANRSRVEQISTQRSLDRRLLVERQATIDTRRKELQDRLVPLNETNGMTPAARAAQFLARTQLDALVAEEELIRERLNRYDLERAERLNNVALEFWTLRRTLQARKVESLQQMLARKRRMESQDLLEELRAESERTFPILRSHISEIEQYAEQVTLLVDKTEKLNSQLGAAKEQLDFVSTEKQAAEAKDIGEAGRSQAYALSLLRQLYELPNVDRYREQASLHQYQLSDATFQEIELRSKARRLVNMDRAIEVELEVLRQQVGSEGLGILEQGLRNNLRKLLSQKRDSIENLKSAYDIYIETLSTLSSTEREVVRQVDEFSNFIHKRIFWMRSASMLQLVDIAELFSAYTWNFTRDDWWKLGAAYAVDFQNNVLLYALFTGVWLLLVLLRIQASRELSAIAELSRKSNYHQILPTLRAILLTALIAAPGPLLLMFSGWRGDQFTPVTTMQAAFALSLKEVGWIYAAFEFFRQLCRHDGVVDAHFNGSKLFTTHFHRDLFLLMSVLLPLFFVISFLHHGVNDQHRLPQERILFCIAMLTITLFAHRTIRPNSQLMREVFQYKLSSAISQTRWVWFPLATLGPLLLALMAWVGYYYTATQLSWRSLLTVLLLAAVLFLWALSLRWYRMAQRWFRMYVLRERLRQPVEESRTIDGQRLKIETEDRQQEENRERQTLQFINYGSLVPLFLGLWMIWFDVLPAVSRLGEVEIWHTYVQTMHDDDGETSVRTVKKVISPLDLALAAFVLALTLFLSRNLPGLVDFAVLQRIGIDPSLRYALTSVIGYLLTFIGLSYAFGALGFRWEQIQWLAAALTFGLSFGLQEIFANFISGLIILFERPVRIGDIVTLDGVTGVVTRIRIRASTITDWDRKEYLVPNKELVTGRVLNWTLSDKINRVQIPVGVAYGSDTDRVREILLEIARNDPEVVSDPAPVAVMENFGDSALNFVLRGFLSSLEKRLETIHRLNTTIHKRFMAEGIEIAFPQQDIHLRNVPPGWSAATPQPPAPPAQTPPNSPENTANTNPPAATQESTRESQG